MIHRLTIALVAAVMATVTDGCECSSLSHHMQRFHLPVPYQTIISYGQLQMKCR